MNSTVIGAGMMFSLGREDAYLTSAGGRVGDKVLVTKEAAIATTGLYWRTRFQTQLERKSARTTLRRSKKYLRKTTVVREALAVVKVGVRNRGISAMHDATEGGVLSALFELASASKAGLRVDLSKIPVSEETKTICKMFRINPYVSLSEGSLVFSCIPSKVEKAISTLASASIRATVVGELVQQESGIVVADARGKEIPSSIRSLIRTGEHITGPNKEIGIEAFVIGQE